MTDRELEALTEFLNDIEEVAQKHGLNIGAYENNMDENEIFDIMFIPALGYDAQFLRFGKKERKKNDTDKRLRFTNYGGRENHKRS